MGQPEIQSPYGQKETRNMSNVITVQGNIGGDPEYRSLNNGGEVISFSVADNRVDGETNWFRVSQFSPNRKFTDHLKKGSSVSVTGVLAPRSFEDKSGATRMSLDVTAFDRGINFVGSKPAADAASSGTDNGDDLPF